MHAPDPEHRPTIKPVRDALASRVYHFDRVQPDPQQIHRLVGLQTGRESHQRWFELVDQMLADLPQVIRPRGVFRIDPVTTLDDRRVVLESGAVYEGAVGRFLKHSKYLATFIVTIGSGPERLSRTWLRAGKVMQGTIADAVASEAAEATAEQLCREVRTWAHAHDLETTPAYSPGYCGMSVRQQVPLFASLPTHLLNVQLTPSCLMIPVKSISGLIGLGPADLITPGGYPCQTCDHPHCMQRRAPFDATCGVRTQWEEYIPPASPSPDADTPPQT